MIIPTRARMMARAVFNLSYLRADVWAAMRGEAYTHWRIARLLTCP